MAKNVRGYRLYVVPCIKETEFVAHRFERSCVDSGTIYILTKKKIGGAVQIDFKDKRIGHIARGWINENMTEIEIRSMANSKKLRSNVKKFIESYKLELEKEYEEHVNSAERKGDDGGGADTGNI